LDLDSKKIFNKYFEIEKEGYTPSFFYKQLTEKIIKYCFNAKIIL